MIDQDRQSIINKSADFSHILFVDQRYVSFGGSGIGDFVKIGKVKTKSNPCVIDISASIINQNKDDCLKTYKSIQDLSDPTLVSSFRLIGSQIKFIQKTIKSFNATHLMIRGDKDGINLYFYDILKLIPQARLPRKHQTVLLVHQLKKLASPTFDVMLNAKSVLKLPTSYLDVGVGKNKVCIFNDDETNEVYLLRDLEIRMPFIHSFSDRLGQHISLSLAPKSLLVDQETSPPEDLPLEYDDQDF